MSLYFILEYYNNDMSSILRNKHGNLSKVKYFLPAYRTPQDDPALK